MCCRWCELPLVPLLTAPAAIISVVSMSAKAWLDGYLGDGSLFLRLSPWYLCVADCKDCGPHDPASHQRVCFWMRDWESTGFGKSAFKDPIPKGTKKIFHIRPKNPTVDTCNTHT